MRYVLLNMRSRTIQGVLAQPRERFDVVERALLECGFPISVDDPVEHARGASEPNLRDICYARQNRQQSVQDLAKIVDLVLVVGSKAPSIRNRDALGLVVSWFDGVGRVGLTARAGAFKTSVQGVISGLRRLRDTIGPILAGVAEDVKFKFPAEVH